MSLVGSMLLVMQVALADTGAKPLTMHNAMVSLQIRQQPAKIALEAIEQQTPFRFLYTQEVIDESRKVSYTGKNVSVATALMELFHNQRIEFRQRGKQILIVARPPKAEIAVPLPTFSPALPQSPATVAFGSVQGRILDASTNEPLPGASVFIKKTTFGTSTNLKGEFVLSNIPEGKRTITISYLGYDPLEITSEIQANRTVSLGTVRMKPSASSTLGEVTVRGSIEGQQKALNQQRTADNIKNIVSADLIGRFPDLNVAEALQRIPGINIERDRGEGGVVQMRGAPPSFTTININGEQIPGTQTEGVRNEELSLIPVDQLSSIEVTKAITSDQDGDNIGGTVDFRTPSGKGLNWKGKAEVGGGYNNIVQRANFIGKFGLNRRFLPSDRVPEGRFGMNIGGSYFGSNLGRDRTTYNYNSVYTRINGRDYVLPTYYRLRDLENFRSRTGATVALDYKFSPKSEIYFNYMYSRRYDRDEEARVQFDFNTARFVMDESTGLPTGNTATTIRRFMNPRFNDVRNHSYSLGGQHIIGKMTVDYLGFWSNSFNQAFIGRTYDIRSAALSTTFTGWGSDFANLSLPSGDIHDPFLMRSFRNYTDQFQTIEGRNASFKANFTLPYLVGNNNGTLKFGGKYRTINNERIVNNQRYAFVNDGSVNINSLFARYTSSREDQQFLRSSVRFGPTLDAAGFDQFVSANPNVWRFDENATLNESIPAYYNADENVAAAYVMNKLNFGKFMLLAGLRYEHTSVNYISRAFQLLPNGNIDKNSIRDINGGTDYDFLLPNIHLKYSLDEYTNLRAALTYSYARPNFGDLAPVQRVNANNLTVDLGNPDLKPASSTNFDLLFERYFKNVGIISGGFFHKSIRDFNFTRTYTDRITVNVRNDQTGAFEPFTELFTITQTQNGETATVYGFEVNLQSNLTFLPGVLKGIGVYANYTYTNSKANTFDRKNVRLPGQAMHTGNFALSYDIKKFTVRGAFNFNGGLIRSLGPVGTIFAGDFDTWRADRYQLDLSAAYRITKKIRAYAELINITNRPDIEYFGIRSRVANLEYYDWWNRFGVSYSF